MRQPVTEDEGAVQIETMETVRRCVGKADLEKKALQELRNVY